MADPQKTLTDVSEACLVIHSSTPILVTPPCQADLPSLMESGSGLTLVLLDDFHDLHAFLTKRELGCLGYQRVPPGSMWEQCVDLDLRRMASLGEPAALQTGTWVRT